MMADDAIEASLALASGEIVNRWDANLVRRLEFCQNEIFKLIREYEIK